MNPRRVAALTYRELAVLLGTTHGTVRRWAHEGMPTVRVGSAVRVEPEAARAWLAATRTLPFRPRAASVVYFAAAPDRIKIGFSSDPERREREIGALIVATVPGSKALEGALHRHFAAVRIDGEWFARTYELEALIGCLAQPGSKAA
jgi:excisionase family DNA binding protein